MGRRKPEIVESEVVKNDVVAFSPNLPVSRASLAAVAANRKLLVEFVQNQLKEGVDFGVIPGTKEKSLYKPGAEKFAKLFNLTVKKELTDKEIDRHGNFAMFTYRATVYSKSGLELAQCEGSCNSQEKKYRERKEWNPDRTFTIIETPICDILNTLQKMAQKRAMVGAIIEAVGASDFYTQDMDDEDERAQNGRSQPAVLKAAIPRPNITSASSQEVRPEKSDVEICECGNRMMISRVNESTWYCVKCKATKDRS